MWYWQGGRVDGRGWKVGKNCRLPCLRCSVETHGASRRVGGSIRKGPTELGPLRCAARIENSFQHSTLSAKTTARQYLCQDFRTRAESRCFSAGAARFQLNHGLAEGASFAE